MSYTTNPGYVDLFVDLKTTLTWFYGNDLWENYTFPQSFFDDFRKYYTFSNDEYLSICAIGVLLTILRYMFEIFFCKVSRLMVNLRRFFDFGTI
jgi:hypothetical protein